MDIVTLGQARAAGDKRYGLPRPRLRRRPRTAETVITRFESGHGWVSGGTGWTSTNANDATDGAWDAQCVSGVSAGNNAGATWKKTGLTAFDPTGKYFLVMIKVADPTKLANVQLYLGADSAFTNFTLLNLNYNAGQLQPNEWSPLIGSLDPANASVTGTGVGTACVAVQLRIADVNASGGTTIKFGGVSRLSPSSAYPNGVVSFTFDDCWASGYTLAAPILNKYRYPATEYVIIDQIGQSGRLTQTQLNDLCDVSGWTIGGHCPNLADHGSGLPAMSASRKDSMLRTMRTWMEASGLPGDTFAYPGGVYDAASTAAVRKFFSAGRTTDASPKETLPAINHYRLRSKSLGSTDTTGAIQTLIDNAYTYGHHLIFTIHEVVASGASGSTQINSATLSTVVDYCNTKGIPVRTVDEVVATV